MGGSFETKTGGAAKPPHEFSKMTLYLFPKKPDGAASPPHQFSKMALYLFLMVEILCSR